MVHRDIKPENLIIRSDGAVKEAMTKLAEQNVGLNYCRVKALPFTDAVRDFIEKHERVFVVEQNRDAQLKSLLMLDIDADPDKLVSMLHYNGLPMDAKFVVDAINEKMAKGEAA